MPILRVIAGVLVVSLAAPAAAKPPPRAVRRSLRRLGLPFSVVAAPDVDQVPHDTGKGPTRHVKLFTDAFDVDIIEWPSGGLACQQPLAQGAVVEQQWSRNGVHVLTTHSGPGGRDGEVCDTVHAARCIYYRATSDAAAAAALAICLSIDRAK